MQTLHAGCSKAEPKHFRPPQTLFPGARNGQNLISWRRSLHLPTKYKPSLVKIDAHNFELSCNRPTNPQTHRQDRLQYTAPQLACSVRRMFKMLTTEHKICNVMLHHIQQNRILLYSNESGRETLESLQNCAEFNIESATLYKDYNANKQTKPQNSTLSSTVCKQQNSQYSVLSTVVRIIFTTSASVSHQVSFS